MAISTTTTRILGLCFLLIVCFNAMSMSHDLRVDTRRAMTSLNSTDKILACYYINHGMNETKIPPQLCTHIIFASALVSPTGMKARNPDDVFSWRLLAKLKESNPALKILVSLCCDFETVVGKSQDVLDSFVNGTKSILAEYNLDGVDLDWEFPGVKQRKDFAVFQQVLGKMLHAEGKLMSLATVHDVKLFLAGFVPEIVNTYVDFITVMTYDYYFYSPKNPYVEYNSPLIKAAECVENYKKIGGINPSKLLLGYANYGRTWKLANYRRHGLHAKIVGKGTPSTPNFPWICSESKKGGVMVNDGVNGAQYLYHGDHWTSFNGLYSALIEAFFVREHGIGGIGCFSLGDADYNGTCGHGPFPVFETLKSVLSQS